MQCPGSEDTEIDGNGRCSWRGSAGRNASTRSQRDKPGLSAALHSFCRTQSAGHPVTPRVTSPKRFQMETGLPRSTDRKRRRPALVCEQCRIRKTRCDRNTPCDKCTRGKRTALCVYTTDDASSVSAPDKSQYYPPALSPAPSGERAAEPSPGVDLNSSVVTASGPRQSLTESEESNLGGSDPKGADRGHTAGAFWKGRIFGPSHYLNVIEHVCQ